MGTVLSIIVYLAIGALIGWIAQKLMKGKSSLIVYIIIGIVGSALGGWLAGIIGLGGGILVQILISIGGACLLIFLFRLIFGKKK